MATYYIRGTTKFTPDETGGGTLTFKVLVKRPGFRDMVETKSIYKTALSADNQAEGARKAA